MHVSHGHCFTEELTLLFGLSRDVEERTLECHGDVLVVDIVDSELRLKNWQFKRTGRGTANVILDYVEHAVCSRQIDGAHVTSVVNYRFANHLDRRGWRRTCPSIGCAPDYTFRTR